MSGGQQFLASDTDEENKESGNFGTIRVEGHICEGQTLSQEQGGLEARAGQGDTTRSIRRAREVRVTVIRGGASSNGYYYNEAALRAIAALLDSAQAYVDHARTEADSQVRSVRDIVGFYHNPTYVTDPREPAGRVDATLHILESADWLWSTCGICNRV